jgi:hypothetical protein
LEVGFRGGVLPKVNVTKKEIGPVCNLYNIFNPEGFRELCGEEAQEEILWMCLLVPTLPWWMRGRTGLGGFWKGR